MVEKKFEVGKGSAVTILIILSLLWLINFADRSIMTVVLEAVKADLKLTDAQAGGLVAMVTAGIAILTIPASIFGDRWARRKVITVMALIWSAATLATAFCMNLGQMLDDVKIAVEGKAKIGFHGRPAGGIPTPEEILEKVKQMI